MHLHQRAALGFCRCQGIDLSCAARCGNELSSTGRGFYSSSRTCQSAQAAATGNEEDERNASRSSFSTSQFRGGWGTRLPKRGPSLSAAEIASRQALLSKKGKSEASDSPLKGNHDPSSFANNRSNQYHRNQPALKSQTPLQLNTFRIPYEIRSVDWNCPQCNYRCHGRHARCPSCETLRPELISISKRQDLAEQNIKIKRLGRSVLDDWNQGKLMAPKDGAQPQPDSTVFRDKAVGKKYYAGNYFPSTRSIFKNVDRPENSPRRPSEDLRDLAAATRIKSLRETPKEETSFLDQSQKAFPDKKTTAPSIREHKAPKGSQSQRQHYDDDFDEEHNTRRVRRQERKRLKGKALQKNDPAPPSPLYLPEFISVSNLADVIGVRLAQFIERMEEMGFEEVSYNHILDVETAGLVAAEFNFEPIFETATDDLTPAPEPEDKSSLPQRPPVVTIMGHVDHGKTTILDWLRKSSIVASEHGGITQHIGAFSVTMPSGKIITFLDTPGHAAFLDMRRRGADVTDIVVLVVAADDSVKPQTIEAIRHAKEAEVPIIVAINKVDKDNVHPEKVKQDLARHSVDVEDYGGDVQSICVSGKTGQGMLELEEAIATLSELLDHRAPVGGNAEGWVIEATTKNVGRVATVLVKRGTMQAGDIVVAGTTWARIRTLRNELGVAISEATPGMPVEIDGWKEQPEAGAEVLQAPSEQRAKDVVDYRLEKFETAKLSQDMSAINETRREALDKRRRAAATEEAELDEDTPSLSGPKQVNFLVKADVSGSVEAIVNSISAIGNNEVYAHILRSGVGPVSEFDVKHAAMAEAHIVSFNMPVIPSISGMAEAHGVELLKHNIIYELINTVKAKVGEHLTPNVSQRVTGEAEIGQIFKITVKGRETIPIAGCKVRNGIVSRTKKVRVLRGEEVVYDGAISSLKNVKKDVTDMRKGTECGVGFESWLDFAVGDHIQCYEEIYENRYL
ncbi:hypothetical protein V8E54_001953 [Elaphomyces granulatus]